MDIFSKRFVFFPMNDNNHWTLAVADIRIKTLLYFDSLSRAREDKKKKGRDGKGFLRNLYRYLKDEHLLRKNTNLPGDGSFPCSDRFLNRKIILIVGCFYVHLLTC